ncbi:MAG: hypothetical protein IJM09_00845 [Neisseriaceae bacterium]|nr:hypothetical protein [Neisseriaceae bacterium]
MGNLLPTRFYLSFRLPETIYRQAYGLFVGLASPPYGVSVFFRLPEKNSLKYQFANSQIIGIPRFYI